MRNLKNPKNYTARSCAAASYSSSSETRSTMTSSWGYGGGLMIAPYVWSWRRWRRKTPSGGGTSCPT
jgi:hypothetical protein